MSSFCIDSIAWCCFVVPLFRCCSILIVSPVFRCHASVPVFRQCSARVPCSVVPCFGVSGFIRNTGTRNTDETAEHPGTLVEQLNTLEHQQNTPKHQQNTNITPADPGTTESYKTKNNCSDFKKNSNLTLIHLTLSAQGGNIFCY